MLSKLCQSQENITAEVHEWNLCRTPSCDKIVLSVKRVEQIISESVKLFNKSSWSHHFWKMLSIENILNIAIFTHTMLLGKGTYYHYVIPWPFANSKIIQKYLRRNKNSVYPKDSVLRSIFSKAIFGFGGRVYFCQYDKLDTSDFAILGPFCQKHVPFW